MNAQRTLEFHGRAAPACRVGSFGRPGQAVHGRASGTGAVARRFRTAGGFRPSDPDRPRIICSQGSRPRR